MKPSAHHGFDSGSAHGHLLESSVHAFDLTVDPWMVRLGEPVLDVMGATDLVEAVNPPASGGSIAILGQLGELDAVVARHDLQVIGSGCDRPPGRRRRWAGRP